MHQVVPTQNGKFVRVDILSDTIFRLRVRTDENFPDGPLVRYGILRNDWPDCGAKFSQTGTDAVVQTSRAELRIAFSDGRCALRDASGNTRLAESAAPILTETAGFSIAFALTNDRLYGLGDNDRDCLQRRGRKYKGVIRNVSCYAPSPFLMSSNGWALFLNTTWYHYIDVGATVPDTLKIDAPQGDLDYYLVAGDSLPELLDHYTALAGRPALLPRWAYGLTFVCDERGVRARDVLYEAFEFRRQGIPCDVIGLEPDWMETHYDFSVDKKWSPERFHIPFWLKGDHHATFTAGLRNMGFKLSLWLCCDYDFSEYEEACLHKKENPPVEAGTTVDDERDIFKDPHFQPSYFDRITKRGEPWFEHLRKFVDDGARAFKLDGANQICFHPDRQWSNGMADEEMHNLYPLLYNKQMTEGFMAHTKKRAMVYSAGGYAGIQQYSATWAGDTGGGAKPLVASLNHALSGHSNTSADLQVWDAPGVHFGFWLPWSQVLSWHMYNQPWFQGEKLCALFTAYAKLRYRLLPYLYSLAAEAHRTGLPMMRPMPLAFPDDPRSDGLLTQYMLGDAFLVSSFAETVDIPEGVWFDYWTGERHRGPKTIPAAYPADRGGPLFVRGGSIVPMGPEVAYSEQKPPEQITLNLYPGARNSAFTLYEDDGESLNYLRGEFATTCFELTETAAALTLALPPRKGTYAGMSSRRTYTLAVHAAESWHCVSASGNCLCRREGTTLFIEGLDASVETVRFERK